MRRDAAPPLDCTTPTCLRRKSALRHNDLVPDHRHLAQPWPGISIIPGLLINETRRTCAADLPAGKAPGAALRPYGCPAFRLRQALGATGRTCAADLPAGKAPGAALRPYGCPAFRLRQALGATGRTCAADLPAGKTSGAALRPYGCPAFRLRDFQADYSIYIGLTPYFSSI